MSDGQPSQARPKIALALTGIGILVLVAAWMILFGSYGWTTVPRYCAEHYDFGIYVQAIARFSLHELNPWLSARGVYIFNDHFDPILFAAVLLRPFTSPSFAGLLTEHAWVLASLLPVVWLWKKHKFGALETLTVCALLLFSVGTVDAALFPIHPTTWSLFPAMLLGAAWVSRSELGTLISVALLFACKEEHVFCGPFLAAGLWVTGQRRSAYAVLMLAVCWATFVFVLRPMLWGPTVPYLQTTVGGVWNEPGAVLTASVRSPKFRRLGTLLIPLLPLAIWAIRARRPPAWGILLSTLPLLVSRFLSVKWAYQYGSPLIGLWVAAFVPSLASSRLPLWASITTLLLLATSLENPLRDAIARLRPSPPSICSKDPVRLQGLERGLKYLQEHRSDAALVTSTLVAPLADRPEIYALGSSRRLSRFPYRYLLVEKPPSGYDWPLSPEQVLRVLDDYRGRTSTRIIFENPYVLLAEGNF